MYTSRIDGIGFFGTYSPITACRGLSGLRDRTPDDPHEIFHEIISVFQHVHIPALQRLRSSDPLFGDGPICRVKTKSLQVGRYNLTTTIECVVIHLDEKKVGIMYFVWEKQK